MSSSPGAVLFDVDNTLLHLDCDFIAEKLSPLGWKMPPEALERGERLARPQLAEHLSGIPRDETDDPDRTAGSNQTPAARKYYVRQTLENTAVPPPMGMPLDLVTGMVTGYLMTSRGVEKYWSRVPDGTRETLDVLRTAGWKIAAVDNSPTETMFPQLSRRLEAAGLLEAIDVVVESVEVGAHKPHPLPFERALEQLEVTADRAVAVGDLFPVDIVGARAAGIDAVLLDPLDIMGDVDAPRIASLAELPAFLETRQRA